MYKTQNGSIILNKNEGYLTFDGVGDYFVLNIPNTFSMQASFSFFCRFNLSDYSESTFLSNLYISSRRGFYVFAGLSVFGFPSNHFVFTFYDGSSYRGGVSTSIEVGKVVNIHIVSEGGSDINNVRIYKNGIEATMIRNGYIPNFTPRPQVANRTFIDSGLYTRYFYGKMYNQSIVTYAKTQTEIELDNNLNYQSLDAQKGSYWYNINFDQPYGTLNFQTQEANPKNVTIYGQPEGLFTPSKPQRVLCRPPTIT